MHCVLQLELKYSCLTHQRSTVVLVCILSDECSILGTNTGVVFDCVNTQACALQGMNIAFKQDATCRIWIHK